MYSRMFFVYNYNKNNNDNNKNDVIFKFIICFTTKKSKDYKTEFKVISNVFVRDTLLHGLVIIIYQILAKYTAMPLILTRMLSKPCQEKVIGRLLTKISKILSR